MTEIALPVFDSWRCAMNVKLWSNPVKFEAGVGQFRIIASREEAADFLLNH